ncbi:unnamed protein product [Mytilus edulis]|uniref:Uncharacterized protein n=1 Tax=Mytilus edulis TaxID=6550 RepID=A0A8S3RRV7_MYTED|nr:unnamed protein product [Mytilus edulis]
MCYGYCGSVCQDNLREYEIVRDTTGPRKRVMREKRMLYIGGNEPGHHAKPKPGTFKTGKISAAKRLNNKIQAKRMAKSRIMNKLEQIKNKLLTEQPSKPVGVLYLDYEQTTNKFNYDGSGFLLNRFENCRPLSSPGRRLLKARGWQLLHLKQKDDGYNS